jgi:hypothetical protein
MMGGPSVAASNSNTDDERELLAALMSAPAVGVPHAADEETRTTYMDRRRAQAEAYGQFVAKGPIYWPGTGTLVFNTGHAVPLEHVEKWELELADLVERVASPELARVGRRFAERQVELAEAMPGGEHAPADADDGNTGGKVRPAKSAAKSADSKNAE